MFDYGDDVMEKSEKRTLIGNFFVCLRLVFCIRIKYRTVFIDVDLRVSYLDNIIHLGTFYDIVFAILRYSQ